METQTFYRKPFSIKAVRVTEENIEEVSEWCGGRIQNQTKGKFIVVPVHDPKTERQKKAFVGDWVLNYEGRGFKSYPDGSFHKSFDAAPEEDEPLQELMTTNVPVDSPPISSNVFEEPHPIESQTAVDPREQIAGKRA